MTSSEIAETMSAPDAHLVTGYIRRLIADVSDKLDTIGKQLVYAYEKRAWVALGYESWDAYVSAELRTDRLRLDRDDRQDLVVQLRSAGMTTRAIGSAVGVHHDTVAEDIKRAPVGNPTPDSVTGTDGKTYPSSPPVRDEPLLDGEGERRTAPAGVDTPRAQDELPDEATRPVEDDPSPAPSVTPTRDLSDVLEERKPGTRADMQRTALSARWSKLMHAVAEFDLMDMDEVRSAIDDTEASLAVKTLRGVAERLERSGKPGLRVVGGTDA